MSALRRFLGDHIIKLTRHGQFGKALHTTGSLRSGSFTVSGKQDICADGKSNKMEICCKVALVSGGTSGIGLAAASQILAAGARNVVITGSDGCQGKEASAFLNSTYGMGKAVYVSCNVNCMGMFEDAFKRTMEMYNRIDIVVNAVGICDGRNWEKEIVTNIIGTIRGTLLAYRYVGTEGQGKGGCVLNIAGINGLDPLPPAPTLSASQSAIVGLSRSFGSEIHLRKSGIRVVCLCPGFTQTNFIRHIAQRGMTDSMGKSLEDIVKKAMKQGPDACGKAVVHVIKYGENGSVWMCEGSRLFALNLPTRKSYGTLVAQYV